MSLLRKNAILREYRRRHRELVTTQSVAHEERLAEESGDDGTAGHPDIDAFQTVGSTSRGVLVSPWSSPSKRRPNGNLSQEMATELSGAETSGSVVSSDPPATLVPLEGTQSAAGGTRVAEPSTSIALQTFRGVQDSDNRAVDTALATASRIRVSTVRAGAVGDNNGSSLGSFIEPRGPSPSPPALEPLGRRATDNTGLLSQRSQSGPSGRDDRVIPGLHTHAPPNDQSVSPPTATLDGEAFRSVTDVAEAGHRNRVPRKSSTSPPAPSTGLLYESTKDGGCGPSSFPIAEDRLRTPLRSAERGEGSQRESAAAPRSNEAQTAINVELPVATVSPSTTSSSSSFTGAETNGERSGVGSTHAALREDDVRQLDIAHAMRASDSRAAGGLCRKTSALTVMRQDLSDTLMQPPTSILSEMSTITTQANVRPSASFHGGGRAAANNSSAARAAAYAVGLDDGNWEGLYSPISETAGKDRGIDAGAASEGKTSLEDSRAGVVAQQMLSHTGTSGNSQQIWDNEDIDVDLGTTINDTLLRSHHMPPPISFCEAYADLTKLHRGDTTAACNAEGGAVRAGNCSTVSPRVPAPVAAVPKSKRKSLASILLCCGGASGGVSTVEKQPRSCTQACAGSHHGERGGSGDAHDTASRSEEPEEHLRVIIALKSEALSLQLLTHRRMLLTVFNALTSNVLGRDANANLTNSVSDTPLMLSSPTSVRWESIGFQGANPATDARATGVLGALQLLYLIDFYPTFAQRLWHLCRDPASDRAYSSPHHHRNGAPPMPPRRVSNELPFVLVCFNFTAIVLDAVGQHLLDDEVRRKARANHLASPPTDDTPKTRGPEEPLSSHPGMYVCCEGFVGVLALFEEAWRAWPQGKAARGAGVAASTPPENLPRIAQFSDIRARLRAQVLRKGAAKLMLAAARRVRGTGEKHQ
ncbi:hypothetical protein JKF63_00143 [Porcisia hertigi]|uniref:ELMO domain-containing protein n=1 Tax=Porcisia hertigi TaxID=2761500 RepID=A0A836KWV5_9TRYP|nr:hypothetical protein JKF63_00143 [Porcisia hertigi]